MIRKPVLVALLATQILALTLLILGGLSIVEWFSARFVEPVVGETIDPGIEMVVVDSLRFFFSYWPFILFLLLMIAAVLAAALALLSKSRPLADRIAWAVALLMAPLPMVLLYTLLEFRAMRQTMPTEA